MLASLNQIREIEKETLQVISTIGEFAHFGRLYAQSQNYRNLVHPSRGGVDIEIPIKLNLGMRADAGVNIPRIVWLGGLVVASADNSNVERSSYFIAICDGADEDKPGYVIRKLHFDIEPIQFRQGQEIKPTAHLQVCGTISPSMERVGFLHEHVKHHYPEFEKPRIPVMPTCMALLINWVLLEFQSDSSAAAILRNTQWRKLVRKAERTILKPYFSQCSQFLDEVRNNEKSFMEEFLYESIR